MVGSIRIDSVSKEFISNDQLAVTALKNITTSIEATSFTSILGASGCGKTTLLRLIAGLEESSSGDIFLDDEKITGTGEERGFVFQTPKLFPWLNVYDNIAFGLKARKVYEKEKDNIEKFIDMVGLNGFEKSFPHQLSGGMQQRVALARALINKPKVLLLDEPLGALDSLTRVTMQDEILRIWEEQKITMIMVTHDVEEAIYLSEKIIVLKPKQSEIQNTINVDLPYPRNRNSEEFFEYKTKLYSILNTKVN